MNPEENIIPEIQEPLPVTEPIMGVVDCNRLNVRKEPNTDGEILCEIKVGTSVVIDEDESTEDFYKIFTVSGIEGFCMREFISIRK